MSIEWKTTNPPKDGNAIIAIFEHIEKPVVAWFHVCRMCWIVSHSTTYKSGIRVGVNPTHWTELPDPPKK